MSPEISVICHVISKSEIAYLRKMYCYLLSMRALHAAVGHLMQIVVSVFVCESGGTSDVLADYMIVAW